MVNNCSAEVITTQLHTMVSRLGFECVIVPEFATTVPDGDKTSALSPVNQALHKIIRRDIHPRRHHHHHPHHHRHHHDSKNKTYTSYGICH